MLCGMGSIFFEETSTYYLRSWKVLSVYPHPQSPTQAKEIGVWKFEILGVGQKILILSPEFPN